MWCHPEIHRRKSVTRDWKSGRVCLLHWLHTGPLTISQQLGYRTVSDQAQPTANTQACSWCHVSESKRQYNFYGSAWWNCQLIILVIKAQHAQSYLNGKKTEAKGAKQGQEINSACHDCIHTNDNSVRPYFKKWGGKWLEEKLSLCFSLGIIGRPLRRILAAPEN